MKVVFCLPYLEKPMPQLVKSVLDSLPLVESFGYKHGMSQVQGNPYISSARAEMTRKAIDANADVIVYFDYDVSFEPIALRKLLDTKQDVVAGTYRFKKVEPEYMVALVGDKAGNLFADEWGKCLEAERVPAGFLKVTRGALAEIAKAYPKLLYGDPLKPHIDLFNHGAIDGAWWGEDYAFCKRWREMGRKVWVYPDLNISHHSSTEEYKGNFHKHLLKQDINENKHLDAIIDFSPVKALTLQELNDQGLMLFDNYK